MVRRMGRSHQLSDFADRQFDLFVGSSAMSFSAKVVQHSINQLLINTINDAERVLQNLPRDGDRVEVITSSSHDISTTRRRYTDSKPLKTTYDVVADKVLRTPSQKSDEKPTQRSDDSPISPRVRLKFPRNGQRSFKKMNDATKVAYFQGRSSNTTGTTVSALECTTPVPPGIRPYVKGT
ncbi:hypothetical protein Y032_0149g2691 [Ancylostoma ceylanicum]|uniref:Uncharacterized protein n=2 Tax=Ancylostoma ceylanicum TaxID=53326 RepID=A0A016T0S6_9BILA|nr:hypothetical protein Y032_0149g2691 [Ancylostoma ceylanicum]